MMPLAGFNNPMTQKKKREGLIEAENNKPGTLNGSYNIRDSMIL